MPANNNFTKVVDNSIIKVDGHKLSTFFSYTYMNKQRLLEILKIPFTQIENDRELKLEVLQNYKEVFDKKPCYSCKNKLKQYHKELVENALTVVKDVESNFKLRSDLGVSRITFNDGQSISQNDAPDEVCIGFLKANPSRISMFEKFPENWQDLITDNESENDDE